MTRLIATLLLSTLAGIARADCSVSQLSGNYAFFVSWIDAGREGFMSGKMELSAGGRAVLRGARLSYKDNSGLVLREGFATGKFGVAAMCTGYLEIEFTDRDADAKIASLTGDIVVSGSRVDPDIQGASRLTIKALPPSLQVIRTDLLGRLSMRRSSF